MAFSKLLISQFLAVDGRVAIVSFADDSNVEQTFTTDETALNNAVSGLVSDGTTATREAIIDAMNIFISARPGVPKILIVVTDGTPNDGSQSQPYIDATIAQADAAQAENIQMAIVGVAGGADFNEANIQRLSSIPRVSSIFYCL